jgi:transcriptional regulator with XRE-family HTH domain
MSFAENLQYYRKNKEITQEQLAEEMGVSRQTISKWEAGTSYPEMEKILQLCQFFGCSMDLLLRGDAQEYVTEDAAGYDRHMNKFSRNVVTGIAIIMLGITLEVLLSAIHFDDNLASAVMLLFIIPGILILVVSGLNKERFCKKYPVIQPFYREEVLERFEQRFPMFIASGIGVILVGVVFQVVSDNLKVPKGYTEDVYTAIFMLFLTVGVGILIYAGTQKSKYDINSYNNDNKPDKEKKKTDRLTGTWCSCIMLGATVLFLIAGLGYNMWDKCWIVFPVGGVLCGIATMIIHGITKDEE